MGNKIKGVRTPLEDLALQSALGRLHLQRRSAAKGTEALVSLLDSIPEARIYEAPDGLVYIVSPAQEKALRQAYGEIKPSEAEE